MFDQSLVGSVIGSVGRCFRRSLVPWVVDWFHQLFIQLSVGSVSRFFRCWSVGSVVGQSWVSCWSVAGQLAPWFLGSDPPQLLDVSTLFSAGFLQFLRSAAEVDLLLRLFHILKKDRKCTRRKMCNILLEEKPLYANSTLLACAG